MNGEVKTYRMNDPMTWKEFKELPDDLKVCYIKAIRKKYNTPNSAIAEMFGVSGAMLSIYFKDLGLCEGKSAAGSKRGWNKKEFMAWCTGRKVQDIPEETDEERTDELIAVNDNPEVKKYIEEDNETTIDAAAQERQAQKEAGKRFDYISMADNRSIPNSGIMTFEGEIHHILRSIDMLLGNQSVRLTIKWDVMGEGKNDISEELNKEELVKKLREYEKAATYALLNEERRRATGSKG